MTIDGAPNFDTRAATRRAVLTGGAVSMTGWELAPDVGELLIPSAHAVMPTLAKDEIAATLLGTSSPIPNADRFGPSTLVEVGGLTLLFDAGRGTAPTGYLPGPLLRASETDPAMGADRKNVRPHWGLADCQEHGGGFLRRYPYPHGDHHIPEAALIEAHDYEGDGVVFDDGGGKVTAFEVNHGPLIKPAFDYRVDYAGHSVTISGDTKLNENVIKFRAGTDLLIHEVCATPAALADDPIFKAIAKHHLGRRCRDRVLTGQA